MPGSQNVALPFDFEEFFQKFPLTVVLDFAKLNLYVTVPFGISFDAGKTVIDDEAYKCGVSGGEFLQVLFPGVTCEVGIDVFVKISIGVAKICVPPEYLFVYVEGSCKTSLDVAWVCYVAEFLF